jgi:hypothetical protein
LSGKDTADSSAFFPVAVWYGGGKARAPMMSPLNATSAAYATIALRLAWKVKTAKDIVADRDVPVQPRGDETVLQKNLAPGAIWVVCLERQ